MNIETVASNAEEIEIARRFAVVEDVSEERAVACAENLFDAGKDFDASSTADLRAYLVSFFSNP